MSTSTGSAEDDELRFDALFHSLAQRRGFRTYLAGLLAPHERAKMLTTLAGAETLIESQAAPLGEMARLYGLRNWIEQGYKQMKDWLGRAAFVVRSDRAIRHHWVLVYRTSAFYW